jgi:hypothetical protein
MQRLWNKKETADFLNVSVRTVDRIRADDLIRSVKVRGQVMFRPGDVEAFLVRQSKRL